MAQRRLPEFDPPVPDADFGARGVVLCSAFEWLDLLARTNDLPSLLAFCDLRPVPGGMRKWLKMLDKHSPEVVWTKLCKSRDRASGAWKEWFPVEIGLQSIAGLVAVLEREGWSGTEARLRGEFPTIMKGRIEPVTAGDLVIELNALAACLRIAATSGARFRLARSSPFG